MAECVRWLISLAGVFGMHAEGLEWLPANAREFVQALLDHDIGFDYVDIYSDQTVRVGRYPKGYVIPATTPAPPEPDLFTRWKGRLR